MIASGAGVGASARRPDVAAKLAGSFVFANDEAYLDPPPGTLFGATVRSPYAHARIVGIDTVAARGLDGVERVFTIDDVPGRRLIGHIVADQPALADGVVRHVGEPVAFVVAATQALARRAAALVQVEYEPLPVLDDPTLALSAHTAAVHPDGNLVREVRLTRGEIRAAPVVVRATWETGRQDQAFLAPEGALAFPGPEGSVVLRVATQDLHADHRQIADALGLADDQVRVELSGVGGAFGGREDITLQVHLALAALVLQRPVATTYRRDESFLAHPHRHPARLTYEVGADEDGTLRYVRADVLLDGGAYASTSGPVLGCACWFAAGPYRVPVVEVTGRVVRTNNPVSGAMRGFGAVQACFGIESTLDLLAARLGIDPVELRRRNVLRPGDAFPTSGQRIHDAAPLLELIDACTALPLPAAPDVRVGPATPGAPVIRRGTGFALGVKHQLYGGGAPEHAGAVVRIDASGAEVASAAAECGQGIDGVLVQIAGQVLGGLPVRLATATSQLPYAGSSSASRQTWMSGSAVRLAAEQALRTLRDVVARRAGTTADRVVVADGGVLVDGVAMTLPDALGDHVVDESATYHAPPTSTGDPTTGQGDVHVSWMWVAHRAVADVDVELGTVRVVQVATAQDVGRAINPREVAGQIGGGISQGVGLALTEHLAATGGVPANASFTDYLIPTVMDMPEVRIALVERRDPDGPFGAKGVGEPPSLSSTAAVAAAIRAATGRPVVRVPVRPDDLVLGDDVIC